MPGIRLTRVTQPNAVGEKLSNAWGLYDMHDNVWERCQDWYGPHGKETVLIDPTGPASGERRVLRGGSFTNRPEIVRSADRNFYQPADRSSGGTSDDVFTHAPTQASSGTGGTNFERGRQCLGDCVPDVLRHRIRERPLVFNAVAELDDKPMDQLMQQIPRKRKRVRAS